MRNEIGVGDQHARRVGMGAEYADRFAGLDQQGLVFVQTLQGFENLLEAGPVARRAADAAIDDQIVGALGHFRVEIVLDHAERGFDQPVAAAQLAAARRADRTRAGHYGFGNGHDDVQRRGTPIMLPAGFANCRMRGGTTPHSTGVSSSIGNAGSFEKRSAIAWIRLPTTGVRYTTERDSYGFSLWYPSP